MFLAFVIFDHLGGYRGERGDLAALVSTLSHAALDLQVVLLLEHILLKVVPLATDTVLTAVAADHPRGESGVEGLVQAPVVLEFVDL